MSTDEQLQYFVGKVCTVFFGPINRSFDERQILDYFVGIIEAVDGECIWSLHPLTKTRNCYFIKHIYSISEEQVLDPNKPEDAQTIKDFKERKAQTYNIKKEPPQEDVQDVGHNDSPFVDVASITQLAKKAKEQFKRANK